MTRYSSIEEVNSALIELEDHERRVSSEKSQDEKYSDLEKTPSRTNSGSISVNGHLVNGTEENGELHEEAVGDSDSESGSGTIDHIDHDDDSDGENHDEVEESEEYDDGGDPASDEDDEVHVRQKATAVDPQDVADFDRELRALMQVRCVTHE